MPIPTTSLTVRRIAKIPTLRSIEDVRGSIDLEKVINVTTLYELGIDVGHDEHNARAGVWHPSSAGYCKRRTVMHYINTPPTDAISVRMKEIFEVGHTLHDVVQARFEKLAPHVKRLGAQYEFQREVPCDRTTDTLFLDLNIAGTADGILRIWNAEFEQRALLEIKTQSDKRHEELLKMRTAYEKHLLQSHLYAFRFDLPLIYVFYLNKDNQKREVRTHLFDHAIFDAAVLYFTRCGDFVKRGELPPREESWFECKECPYRTACGPEVLRRSKQARLPTVPVRALRRKGT